METDMPDFFAKRTIEIFKRSRWFRRRLTTFTQTAFDS